jgi:hypothetical protein
VVAKHKLCHLFVAALNLEAMSMFSNQLNGKKNSGNRSAATDSVDLKAK